MVNAPRLETTDILLPLSQPLQRHRTHPRVASQRYLIVRRNCSYAVLQAYLRLFLVLPLSAQAVRERAGNTTHYAADHEEARAPC